MTYRIEKEFAFSASHQLDGLPPDHQCARLHGHNYVVKVVLEAADLDAVGFVVDYGRLAPVKTFIDTYLDHRHLNDMLPAVNGPSNPTAEAMAEWLARVVEAAVPGANYERVLVGVSETPKTWAWWIPDD